MKINMPTYRKSLFLPMFKLWSSACILAIVIAYLLNWLIRLLVPSVIDDFVYTILNRMQIKLEITVISITIVTLLFDRACFLARDMYNLNNPERGEEEETKQVHDNLPIDYVLLSVTKKGSFRVKSLLTIGLALHLLIVGYLVFYGHQRFLMSLDLLVGGPGPIIVIEPILLAVNSLFIFCILINAYFWSPVWVNRFSGRYGFVTSSLINALFRLILIVFIIWLYNFTIIKGNGLKIGPQIIFTIILGLLAVISMFPVLTWIKLQKAEKT
jgi:hypothetical protein